jgi:hypothetical protein
MIWRGVGLLRTAYFEGIAFDGWKNRGAAFACQGISGIEKQALVMRLQTGGEAAAALLE